jgi:hypothetical protein
MTIDPEKKDSKVEKSLEDMTAEELSFRICELEAQASDVFRKGGSDKKIEMIDAEADRCADQFEKLTGRKFGEPKK